MWSGTTRRTNRSLGHSKGILAGELPPDVGHRAVPRELAHDRRHPERSTVHDPLHDNVIDPDAIPVRRPQADGSARSRKLPYRLGHGLPPRQRHLGLAELPDDLIYREPFLS